MKNAGGHLAESEVFGVLRCLLMSTSDNLNALFHVVFVFFSRGGKVGGGWSRASGLRIRHCLSRRLRLITSVGKLLT